MNFRVNFIPKGRNNVLIEGTGGEAGFDMIDIVEEKLGKKINLDYLSISTKCPIYNNNFTMNIQRPIAEAISHFRGKNRIQVFVKPGSFGKYMYMHIEPYKHREITGRKFLFPWIKEFEEYTTYDVSFRLKIDEILDDWLKDGCPLEWSM